MAEMRLLLPVDALAAWGTDAFDEQFKALVEVLPHSALPLQQGLERSSYVSSEPFRVMVRSKGEERGMLHVEAGIFYSGIIAGCSCADDPTPIEPQTEYCTVQFTIERDSGETRVSLLADD